MVTTINLNDSPYVIFFEEMYIWIRNLSGGDVYIYDKGGVNKVSVQDGEAARFSSSMFNHDYIIAGGSGDIEVLQTNIPQCPWRTIGSSGGGGGGSAVLITKTVTANGAYSAFDDGADGYSRVTVNVPAEVPDEIKDTIEGITGNRPETLEEVIAAIEGLGNNVPDEIKDTLEDLTGNRPETLEEVIAAIDDVQYVNVPDVDPDDPTHIADGGAISVENYDNLNTCLGNMETNFTGEEKIIIPNLLTIRTWLKDFTGNPQFQKEVAAEVTLSGVGSGSQNPLDTRILLGSAHYIRVGKVELYTVHNTLDKYTLRCYITFNGSFVVNGMGTKTTWLASSIEMSVPFSAMAREDLDALIRDSRYVIIQE